MPPVTNAAYPGDISLTIGATTYDFMLVTPPNESKQLDIEEVATPTGIFELRRINTPDVLTHQDFDLKQDVPWSQNTFVGGAGQFEFTDKTDEINYLWSSGVVTHTDGKAYLPKVETQLSFNSSITNFAGNGYGWRYPYCSYMSGTTRYDFWADGTVLYRRTTGAWAAVWTSVRGNITDIQVINGKLFIATPSMLDADTPNNTAYWYQSDPTAAATWSPTAMTSVTGMSDALGKPSFFLQVRGETYAFVQNNRVLFNVDPTANSWVGPIDTSLTVNGASQISGPPGGSTNPFINVLAVNNFIFAFKQEGVYSIDANQEVREAVWQWHDKVGLMNFNFSASANGLVYYSMSPEIWAYDPVNGKNAPIGFATQAGFSVVRIEGLAANNKNAYILATVTVPYIGTSGAAAEYCALFRTWQTSASAWQFEIIWSATVSATEKYAGLTALPDATGLGTTIYFVDFTSTGAPQTIALPSNYDESTTGGFAASGDLYMSVWRTGFPNFTKRWAWIGVTTENVDANNTIRVDYSLDLGTTWTTLSTLTASGLKLLDLTGQNSQAIMIRFHFVSQNGTVTPVLRVFDLHGRPRFRYLRQVKAAVRVADYIELLNGKKSTDTAAVIKTNLETLRGSDSSITYRDFVGNQFLVGIDLVGYKPTRHEVPESSYELEAQIQMSELGSGT